MVVTISLYTLTKRLMLRKFVHLHHYHQEFYGRASVQCLALWFYDPQFAGSNSVGDVKSMSSSVKQRLKIDGFFIL